MTSEASVVADRYQLGDVLGRGGMADVHRATDLVLHREVAVKVLRDTAHEESDRLRFIAEARTLARLSHPGLVTVLDAGTTAERPYLVMELVEGQTLAQCCSGRPLPPARVAAVGAQLAEALAYAHDEGVVHRDVKPGNVLLDRDDRVKLADFGIARLIGDTVRHTQTGQAIGTAAYLAPEQVRGHEVTPAADVYSLGLVLLEALTGARAFPGAAMESALARLQRGPEIPAWLPEEWRDLLVASTALEPEGRPTAREAADRLALLAAGRDAGGTPDVVTPAGDATLVLPRPTPAPAPPAPTSPAPATPARPLTTRVLATRVRGAVAGIPTHLWGVIGAVVAILVVLVVVAVATADGSRSGDQGIPADTPQPLRQPLQDLHDAVHGTAS